MENGTYTRQIEGFKIIKEFSILLDKEPCYSQVSTDFQVSQLRPCQEDTIVQFEENGQEKYGLVASKQNPELEEIKKYIAKKRIKDFKKLKEYDKLKKSVNTLKNKPEIEKLKAEIEQLKKIQK